MNKPSLVIVVLEDDHQKMLIFRYLVKCGWQRHAVRIHQSPSGRGSAESWVRERFVKETSAYRSSQGPGLTAPVRACFLHKPFPHSTFCAPSARWGLMYPYRMPLPPALDEVSVDEHFLVVILKNDDDKRRFIHPPIPGLLILKAVNSPWGRP